MRMSREATAQSKARILSAAAKMVRERGVNATGVADVMQAAGMTNGGFYRHFSSKDDMIVMAIRTAFAEITDRFDARLQREGPEAAIAAYIKQYLSEGHIEHAGHGCPIASIGADAGRNSEVFAEEFVSGAEQMIERLSDGGGGCDAAKRGEVIRCLAMLVGAVVMARAVGNGPLRKEIIDACLENMASQGPA